MTVKTIFDFRDYKPYLKYIESNRPNHGRGFRAELARTVGCQTAYISQVFNGNSHLSLEQGYALNEFLTHTPEEARFFVLLIEYQRAGTKELRRHFLELMEEQVQKQLNLKDRFKVKDVLGLQEQTAYYSEWANAAVHIALTIPELRSIDNLCTFLALPKNKVQKVIQVLVSSGLVKQTKPGYFEVGNARLHLGSDSPLISKHHMNWRMQAMNSLEHESERNLHYTSIVSLSYEDVLALKARFVKEMDAFNETVRVSAEETLSCLSLDFFTLDKR